MNAMNLKKYIVEHGDKEVWFTPPRADFSIPVVSCCTSCAMNYTEDREGLKYDSPVLGCTAYPEQAQTSKGIVKVNGITLREFYQQAVDARKHRMFVRWCDGGENPAWEINGFKIHEEWIELYNETLTLK